MKLDELEPKSVWSIFEEITRIPRCSGHENKLQDWIETWSEINRIAHYKDEVGNIILSKKAATGFESYPDITFQVHQDMVCDKLTQSTHNFETDPLEIYIRGGYVIAKDTTLGADNGIGIAMAMAALVDPETSDKGKLEVIMTVEEETSFRGASNIKRSYFEGKNMINLDSEEAGVIIVESAGGCSTEYKFRTTQQTPEDWIGKRLEVDGLQGGHSGVDINQPRVNAIKLISEGLTELGRYSGLRISRIEGGTRGNAIPRSASCDFIVPLSQSEKIKNTFKEWENKVRSKYSYESTLVINLKDSSLTMSFPEENSFNILRLINDFPQGVIKFSEQIKGLVQTSTNIGIIKTENNTVSINILSRSSDNNDLKTLSNDLNSLGARYGAETNSSTPSHGWSTPPDSPLVQLTVRKYRDVTGLEPKITGIHGGLECSQFAALDPEIQIVSIGSTIESPHSPQEKLEIASVPIVWNLLKLIIRDINSLGSLVPK